MHDSSGLCNQHGTYLNTATYGLPPTPAFDATIAALEDWRTGRTGEDAWEASTERARATFARLIGVAPTDIAVGATVSELIGLIAASVPDGARVLTAANDFSSTIFPFAAHEARGVRIDCVPLADIANAVTSSHAMVVLSHVQAQSGEVADLAAIIARCKQTGTQLCVDGTQSCGWLPTNAREIDYYIVHAYKWLLSPRGSAFMADRRERLSSIVPLHAGWYATEDPNNNLFGLPSRISTDTARRLDTSPAWFSWVGTAVALELIESIGVERIYAHDMALASRFCEALDLPGPASPIVYLGSDDGFAKLLEAGVRASVRAGRVRVSFHIYNTADDVARAVGALASAV
ncbi:MAG: aminotransferase class V-fold PLP-dependent enzyme, partial [Candidatus Eremiobacteraeota bacterium]|nr:aminotransferase class V-fold PLP-dependent enzyme [Candidatus Eremiobacteraeota bacterium]